MLKPSDRGRANFLDNNRMESAVADFEQRIVGVVDDDDGVRDSMRFLLESEGYAVEGP